MAFMEGASLRMKLRKLFGENMSAYLPDNIRDVSDLREVPDNQEVFAHPQTDQSLIIEIMEEVTEADEQALKTHFEDVASSNDAVGVDKAQIDSMETIPKDQLQMTQCSSAWYLCGQQKVSKFKEFARNCVTIHMGLFRLPQYQTDILITFNDPTDINADSSSHQAVPTGVQPWTVEQFRQTLTTLTLLDEGLLAGHQEEEEEEDDEMS